MVRAGLDSVRLIGRETSPLVVFFPTQKETFLGFVIQGPYRTTPARDNVPEHDEWNRALVRETASLLAGVLAGLRDEGLLTVEVLQALPLDTARFGPETMFRALFECARAALSQEEMIPAADGGYRSARQLKLASGAGLRDLLTPDLLGELYGEDGPIAFAADAISDVGTPVLWRYLRQETGLDEVTPETVVARRHRRVPVGPVGPVDRQLLPVPRPASGAVAGAGASGRSGRTRSVGADYPARRRHAGGPVRRARPARGLSPGPAETEFATVRRAIAAHPGARQFLTALGFSEPDVVAEVLDYVLPRYHNADIAKLDAAQHDADIELVARALDGASAASREQLLERLRQTTFLVGENAATGEQRLMRPGDLYQRTKALECYFDGNPDAWLAADGYGPWLTQLRGMGVRETVRVDARPADELGYVTIAEEFARHERGVAGFDPSARIDGLEYALGNPDRARSEFVWNALLVPSRAPHRRRSRAVSPPGVRRLPARAPAVTHRRSGEGRGVASGRRRDVPPAG